MKRGQEGHKLEVKLRGIILSLILKYRGPAKYSFILMCTHSCVQTHTKTYTTHTHLEKDTTDPLKKNHQNTIPSVSQLTKKTVKKGLFSNRGSPAFLFPPSSTPPHPCVSGPCFCFLPTYLPPLQPSTPFTSFHRRYEHQKKKMLLVLINATWMPNRCSRNIC